MNLLPEALPAQETINFLKDTLFQPDLLLQCKNNQKVLKISLLIILRGIFF